MNATQEAQLQADDLYGKPEGRMGIVISRALDFRLGFERGAQWAKEQEAK